MEADEGKLHKFHLMIALLYHSIVGLHCGNNHRVYDLSLTAMQDNIDKDLSVFLKKYFPKEVTQKQIALETAAGIEQFGIFYKHPSESKCLVM